MLVPIKVLCMFQNSLFALEHTNMWPKSVRLSLSFLHAQLPTQPLFAQCAFWLLSWPFLCCCRDPSNTQTRNTQIHLQPS